MPTPCAPRIILAQNARADLHALLRAHSTPQSLALRARLVLRAADLDRPSNLAMSREGGCDNHTAGKWRRRYLALGLSGLQDAVRSGRPKAIAASTRVQVISVASTLPQEQERPVTRWTLNAIATTVHETLHTDRSAVQASGVFCTMLISSRIRVHTGLTATRRTWMPRPTRLASFPSKHLRPMRKAAE